MTKSNHVKYLELDGRKNLDLTQLEKSRMLWVKLSEQFRWEFKRPECQQNVDSEGWTHEVSYENTDYLGNWMDYRPFYVISWQKFFLKNSNFVYVLSVCRKMFKTKIQINLEEGNFKWPSSQTLMVIAFTQVYSESKTLKAKQQDLEKLEVWFKNPL